MSGVPDDVLLPLRERLRDWEDIDVAGFYLGKALGVIAPGDSFGTTNGLFLAGHEDVLKLIDVLEFLVDQEYLEHRDPLDEYGEYRWRTALTTLTASQKTNKRTRRVLRPAALTEHPDMRDHNCKKATRQIRPNGGSSAWLLPRRLTECECTGGCAFSFLQRPGCTGRRDWRDRMADARDTAAETAATRDLWTRANRDCGDEHADRAWAAEDITWGIFNVPQRQLGVLGDVASLDVVELGCGTAYFGR